MVVASVEQEHEMSSTRPTHSAYVVIDPPAGSDRDRKATWLEIAPCWTHKDGEGFDIFVPAGVSLSGRIVVRARRNQDG
jgi:hypothetical protein